MKKLAFCEYCIKENTYKILKLNKTSILKNEEILYRAKQAICECCKNEIFVSDICDYNLKSLYEEYRKKYAIIDTSEIERIIVKYSINKESLSLLLGWERQAVDRYLNGDMLTISRSDILKKILDDSNYYLTLLKAKKERINPVDFNISRQAVNYILNSDVTEDKIDAVIKYFIIRCEDFTPTVLYKLLYYVQGFHYVFANKYMFSEDFEASKDGPICKSVYERYKIFGYEEVNKDILSNNKLKLSDEERNVVESIIKFFGCYSGKILRLMTQSEAPWILTRTNIIHKKDFEDENYVGIIEKKLISEYFRGIKYKYDITNQLDIEKYSIDLFQKISM